MTKSGLETVYDLKSAGDSQSFYDGWAAGYDAELAKNCLLYTSDAADE